MKIEIDTKAATLSRDGVVEPLYSDSAFQLLSSVWNKVGWNQKYPYTFTWHGMPIIQSPEDLVRYQEVVFSLQPDVIIETGIAHGGSAVLSAGILKLIGKGRVIAVDIEIRPHNRKALDAHPLNNLITLFEGSSVDASIIQSIKNAIKPDDSVMVVLDSNHTYAHVTSELEAYAPLVTIGSYIVATDGSMRDLHDVPRGAPHWKSDNPAQAAIDFASRNSSFVVEQPKWRFNESHLSEVITHWPDAWLKRVS
jgi:cephalosporin hydroxylase